jgi:hypothetical protein
MTDFNHDGLVFAKLALGPIHVASLEVGFSLKRKFACRSSPLQVALEPIHVASLEDGGSFPDMCLDCK